MVMLPDVALVFVASKLAAVKSAPATILYDVESPSSITPAVVAVVKPSLKLPLKVILSFARSVSTLGSLPVREAEYKLQSPLMAKLLSDWISVPARRWNVASPVLPRLVAMASLLPMKLLTSFATVSNPKAAPVPLPVVTLVTPRKVLNASNTVDLVPTMFVARLVTATPLPAPTPVLGALNATLPPVPPTSAPTSILEPAFKSKLPLEVYTSTLPPSSPALVLFAFRFAVFSSVTPLPANKPI